MITLNNNFHGSSVSLRAERGQELSLAQVIRARRILCGIEGCTCGGNLSERGRQAVEIELVGIYPNGLARVVVR